MRSKRKPNKKNEDVRHVPLLRCERPYQGVLSKDVQGTAVYNKERAQFERIWGLYRYNDGTDERTIEAKVLIEGWYNFCGGLIMYSPQVDHYSNAPYVKPDLGMWGRDGHSWTNMFCSPGHHGRMYDGTFPSRELFDSRFKKVIPSLNEIFDVSDMTLERAEHIMWLSLAGATLSRSIMGNKRWIVCADHSAGLVQTLLGYMKMLSGKPLYQKPMWTSNYNMGIWPSTEEHHKMYAQTWGVTPSAYMSKVIVEIPDSQSTNWNSGNECAVSTVFMTADARYKDDKPHTLSQNDFQNKATKIALKCMNNYDYSLLAPAYTWSN